MLATGSDVTTTVSVPTMPPLVAVMITVPSATPATRPVADTVAMAPLGLFQTTDALSVSPDASWTRAVS